jgi:hypothetical protein
VFVVEFARRAAGSGKAAGSDYALCLRIQSGEEKALIS